MKVAVIKKYKVGREAIEALIFILLLSLDVFERVFQIFLGRFITDSVVSLCFDGIRALISIYAIISIIRMGKRGMNLIWILIGTVTIIGLSLYVNPKLSIMLPILIKMFAGTYIPALLLGAYVMDNHLILKFAMKLMPLVYFYAIYSLLFEDLPYVYQNVAYGILFYPMAAIAYFCQTGKKRALVHYGIFLLIIIYLGSRGPLLCLALWTAYLFYSTDRYKIRRYMTSFGIVLAGILYAGFWNIFISWLYGYMPDSRTIAMLYKGSFWNSGRSLLYEASLGELKDRWFRFGGFMADRFYLVDNYEGTNKLGFWVMEGDYTAVFAHNIWIELCFCFGTVIGTSLIVFLLISIYNVFKMSRGSEDYYLIVIIVIMGLVPLCFSSSFLTSLNFWIMIGVLCAAKYNRHK